ncbi:YheC/YheD family protein [Paenibacillus alkaliterrae]|uniref:YheC/YheD family protein n=1 Tax=Paenibacillus alkaliterrae TaxID=320909 RepID=UPI001F330FDB|nr:YheC/YheD family protein [Paenibacillus alkaliterrae]MCF2941878.1 YheC/YheD family protein [Paenibacillus alkaliterrae]
MSYSSTTVKSKWTKTKWLLKSAKIRTYMPETLRYSRGNLRSMLSRYSTVYFKPTGGTGGFNIVRITRLASGYRLQHSSETKRYKTFDALYEYLNKQARTRPYLLQKGIKLAATKGQPFDIRVMVQKSNKGSWKSTALFTKIGRPGKVATNYHQGGRLGYFRQTLSGAGFGTTAVRRKEQELKKLGESVGRIFDEHGNGFRELGLDVALDGKGNAWILEVNTRPQFYPLKHMTDKSMHRRIMEYARQYGRKR